MPRYLSWLALAVAAGFLVVASVGFAASAGVSAWTLVASLVFSSSTVQTLAFAGSLAVVGLSLVGLTEHELSHGAEESSDTRKSRAAAA
jgi:hypothetical protein